MYGLIVKKMKSKYFTNLLEVFELLGGKGQKYQWLLSNYECNIYPSEKIPYAEPFVWLDGAELVRILEEHEFQFIWCVATAYNKNIMLNEVLTHPLPIANGYEGFWQPVITMQNPLADIEIVPWDSSLLLVISKSKSVIDEFACEYPVSTDLAEYNSSTM